MKIIANIFWLFITGLISSLAYLVLGALWCVTIVGIPFGLQCFKMAKLMLWPFGKKIKTNFDKHPIANIIWAVFGGLELSLGFIVSGLIWCVTIVGIPFGKQCFKLAILSFVPFGASIK